MQSNRLQFKLNRKTLISIFAILFIILSVSGYVEFLSLRHSVINLMSRMTRNLAQTIQKASVNSILSYDALVHEITDRMLLSLEHIRYLDSTTTLTNGTLTNLAVQSQLYRINIFDTAGRKVLSSNPEHMEVETPEYLWPVLRGEKRELVPGLRPASHGGGSRFVVAVERVGGGAIVGNIDAGELLYFRKEIGIGAVLNSIIEDSSVVYIAIQDSWGILAATHNVDSLSSFQSDRFLQDVQDDSRFLWRITECCQARVFEGILPFEVLNTSYGIVRIGLSYAPIQTIQKVAVRNTIIRLAILLLIGMVLVAYSVSIQNLQLLEAEKEHITQEVYRLQTDHRQKQKFSAMGELAAGVAHEIRNPLNAISMSVQRLGREFPPADGQAEQLALIKTIRKEIARIGEIIQQFLRFARPAPLQKTWIDFNDLVQKVVDLYQAKLLNYGITFKWSRTHPLKTFVDPEQLERAIINLLENAIAATQPGSIIEFQMIDDDQQLRFLVRDSGMGIPPENLSRIFDLYFTTKPNGTGLGLPQVYQVIVEHGGSVVVDSTPGVGTTFTIFLPRNRE